MKKAMNFFSRIDPFRNKRIKRAFFNILKFFFPKENVVIVCPDDEFKIDFGTVRKVLIVRQHNQLGDMLCAVPLFRALREKFPDAKITLVASPINYEVVKDNPFVDEVLNFDKAKFLKSPVELVKFFKRIRQGFDIAIVPSTVSISATSNFIAYLSKARIRIGPHSLDGKENPTRFLFNFQVELNWTNDQRRHQTLRNLDIVRPFGISTSNTSVVIPYFEEDEKFAEEFLKAKESYRFAVGFHPGAGKKPNRWDAEKFAQLAIKLSEKFNALTVITAGPMDDEPVGRMLSKIEGKIKFLLLKNEKIRRVVAIIDKLDLFVTNDTGMMHIAGATRTPLISLFGPTNPYEWAPIGENKFFIKSESGDIKDISVEEVYLLAEKILSRNR